jgi:hypothetical protein
MHGPTNVRFAIPLGTACSRGFPHLNCQATAESFPKTFILCTSVLLMSLLLRICRVTGIPRHGNPWTSAWTYWSLQLIFELFCVLFLSILTFHLPLQCCVAVCYCQCYLPSLILQFRCCINSVDSSVTWWSSGYPLTVINVSPIQCCFYVYVRLLWITRHFKMLSSLCNELHGTRCSFINQ